MILLDEPTNHLDFDSILMLREQILKRNKNGCSFIITSHILNDLQNIATQIVSLKSGKIIFQGDTESILKENQTLEQAYITHFSK